MTDARARLIAVGFKPAELADKSPARCEYLLACARALLVENLAAAFIVDAMRAGDGRAAPLGFGIFASRSRQRGGAARKESLS